MAGDRALLHSITKNSIGLYYSFHPPTTPTSAIARSRYLI